jgi:hypothetical protein
MDKVSFKITSITFFFFGAALILCACMNPVDGLAFSQSESVREIIESASAGVYVNDYTGDNLKGRNGRIEGLNPNRYYMIVEEKDTEGVIVTPTGYPKFATDKSGIGPGGLDSLGNITKISGGAINGLTNFHTYTVFAADFFPNTPTPTVSYTDNGTTKYTSINNGEIVIPSPDGTLILDLSSLLSTGTMYTFTAVSAPALPSNWTQWTSSTITITPTSAITLETPDTTFDYVFYDTLAPYSFFKVLKVRIMPTVSPETFTLTFNWDDPAKPTLVNNTFTYLHDDYYSGTANAITININPLPTGWTVVDWLDDKGNSITAGSLNSTTGPISHLALGFHTFTVIITNGSMPFNLDFTLEVKVN